MHDLYGATTDVYFRAFQKQWQFINDYQRDAEFHGLHEMIDGDGRPVAGGKGRIWKEGYHEGRALLNVTARLQKLAQARAETVPKALTPTLVCDSLKGSGAGSADRPPDPGRKDRGRARVAESEVPAQSPYSCSSASSYSARQGIGRAFPNTRKTR